jgi:hypothetical protein
MRTTLKLVLPLAFSVALVSLLYAGYQYRTQRRNLRNDLSHRATTLAELSRRASRQRPVAPQTRIFRGSLPKSRNANICWAS